MIPTNLLPKIEGIVVPAVTPLLGNGKLDLKGTETLTRHLVDGGVHGMFILGTTGESPSLTVQLRKDLIKTACQSANKEIPVLVGISDTCLEVSLDLAEAAKSGGAVAVVALTPFFFHLDQEDLFHYYTQLAEQCALPLILYNFPHMTKCHLEVQTVSALANHPRIIGIKDSSGNGVYLEKLLEIKAEKPDFYILTGPEEMLAQTVLAGADGGVSGGANLFPKLYTRLFEAAKAKDWKTMQRIQPLILEISKRIYGRGEKSYGYFQGLKVAMEKLGICGSQLASPLLKINPDLEADIQSAIIKISEKVIQL
ncbi:dihydrodipicolinate synthase family protein [Cecembia sp.]|uniref:dihydrodipicolinate synthase family protein n=1 Tax=Cecembia sp. TaxID=1898110 RepID=UPI0025B926E7|nr:dihydrodipicolinate synthase family protein [Cecembia sp.]